MNQDPGADWGPGLYFWEDLEDARVSALTDDQRLARECAVREREDACGPSAVAPSAGEGDNTRARLIGARLLVSKPFSAEAEVGPEQARRLLGQRYDPARHGTGAEVYAALERHLGSRAVANDILQRSGYDCIVSTTVAEGQGHRCWVVLDPDKAERISATVP